MKKRIPTFIWQITQHIFCAGALRRAVHPEVPRHTHRDERHLTPTQDEWMRINKPLYYTGIALTDLPHLPQHLRHV